MEKRNARKIQEERNELNKKLRTLGNAGNHLPENQSS